MTTIKEFHRRSIDDRDGFWREQASLIQKEVGLLLNDVRLLSDRVGKLQNHLGQAEGDIKGILVSAEKAARLYQG